MAAGLAAAGLAGEGLRGTGGSGGAGAGTENDGWRWRRRILRGRRRQWRLLIWRRRRRRRLFAGTGGGQPDIGLAGNLRLKVAITYTLVPPTIAITTPASGATYTQGEVVEAVLFLHNTPRRHEAWKSAKARSPTATRSTPRLRGPTTSKSKAEDKDGAEANEGSHLHGGRSADDRDRKAPPTALSSTRAKSSKPPYTCTPAGGTGVKTWEEHGRQRFGAGHLDTRAFTFEVEAEDEDGGRASEEVTYTVSAADPPEHRPRLPSKTQAEDEEEGEGQIQLLLGCPPVQPSSAGSTGEPSRRAPRRRPTG